MTNENWSSAGHKGHFQEPTASRLITISVIAAHHFYDFKKKKKFFFLENSFQQKIEQINVLFRLSKQS